MSAQIRNVERFNAAGLDGELERFLQGADPGGSLPARFPEVEIEGETGVPADQIHHPAAGALHGNVDLDPAAALFREPVRDQLAFGKIERRFDPRRRTAPHLVELFHRRFHEPGIVHRGQIG